MNEFEIKKMQLWANEMHRLASSTRSRMELQIAYNAVRSLQEDIDKVRNGMDVYDPSKIDELEHLNQELYALETQTRDAYVLDAAHNIRMYNMEKIDRIKGLMQNIQVSEEPSQNAAMFK